MDVLRILKDVAAQPAVRGLAAAACVGALLWLFHRRDRLSSRCSALLALAAWGMAAVGLTVGAGTTLSNLLAPREWDFLCFWTFGQAIAKGGSPYDIELLGSLSAPYAPSEQFVRELYCLYPPPCVVQFVPLGWLSLRAALTGWYVAQWAALAFVIHSLWPRFDAQRTQIGLAVTVALVLALHSTLATLSYAQTNFLIMALVLIAIDANGKRTKGLSLGLAALVKPIGVIFAIDLVAKRRWKDLMVMTTPILVATGLFVLLQGAPGLKAFVERNPISDEIQAEYYTDAINQSLLATIIRMRGEAPGPRPVFDPAFLTITGLVALVTVVAIARLKARDADWGLACAVPLALVVYPGTLTHYSAGLLIPLAIVWRERARLPGGPNLAILATAIAFGLVWSKAAFVANLEIWALVVFVAWRFGFIQPVSKTMADVGSLPGG